LLPVSSIEPVDRYMEQVADLFKYGKPIVK